MVNKSFSETLRVSNNKLLKCTTFEDDGNIIARKSNFSQLMQEIVLMKVAEVFSSFSPPYFISPGYT